MIKIAKIANFVEALEEAFKDCLHMFQPMTAHLVEVWRKISNITHAHTPAIYRRAHMHNEYGICLHASTTQKVRIA